MEGSIRFVLGWLVFAIALVTENTYLLIFVFFVALVLMFWGMQAMNKSNKDWMNRRI
jgi:hypothetical protein